MFELNDKLKIEKEIFFNSTIYTIDNFYKNPDLVLNFILSNESHPHKKDEKPSFNQIYFDDRRHNIETEKSKSVYDFLSKLCNQSPITTNVNTNLIRFKDINFNNYKSNYWWPHYDHGYTGLVYFNKNDFECGTNLYLNLNLEEEPPDFPEHFCPWRRKKNFKLIKSMQPKYNRMIFFDASKFLHGMNICNDTYFKEQYRINQALFFRKKRLLLSYN